MTEIERVLYRAVYEGNWDDPLPSKAKKGRFHDEEMGLTTYLAERPETAWMEVGSRWSQRQPEPEQYRLVEVMATVTKVVDLTESSIRQKYGVELDVLVGADWKPCQRLARRFWGEGFEALWTFSRADFPRGRQLVVFLSHLTPESALRVVHVRRINEAISLD